MDYQCTLSPNSKRLGEHDETKPSLLVGKMGILVPFSFPQRKARSLVQQIEYRPNRRLSSPIQSFTKKKQPKRARAGKCFQETTRSGHPLNSNRSEKQTRGAAKKRCKDAINREDTDDSTLTEVRKKWLCSQKRPLADDDE